MPMPQTESLDESTEPSREVPDLDELLEELLEHRLQDSIDKLAKRHPNGSRLAKKAKRNPEKVLTSRKFIRETRFAVRTATIAQDDFAPEEEIDEETLSEIRADLLERYLQTLERQPKKKSKAFRRAVMLSVALHLAPAGPANYERLIEDEIPGIVTIWKRRIRKALREPPKIDEDAKVSEILGVGDNISAEEAEKRRRAIEDLIIFSPDKARELVLSGEIDLENTWIDHGRFFLLTEYLDGTTEEDTKRSSNAQKELKEEIRADLKKHHHPYEHQQVRIIDKYMRRYGLNNTYRNFYMGDLLTSPEPHQGNCEARAKLAVTIVNDIPELGVKDIRFQFMEIHARVLFKMKSGKWYVIANGAYELPDADITETAMMDRYAYVRGYLGIQPQMRILDQNKDVERRMTLNEKLAAAFALGATSYLAAGGVPGLRSTFDLEGPPDPNKLIENENQYDVEIVEINEETVEKEGLAEGYVEAQELLKKKEEDEEKKYRIPKNKLKNARITGDLELKGKEVNDLSQLKAHEVTTLTLESASVTDFSPLSEAPLEELNLRFMAHSVDLSTVNPRKLRILKLIKTKLKDKRILKEAPLEFLECYDCGIEDLSEVNLNSLQGLKFTGNGRTRIDLGLLQGKPIQELALTRTKFTNFEALANSQIHSLKLSEVDFSEIDTTVLAKMPLKWINLRNTNVSDVSFLRGMPIEGIHLEGTDVSDASALSEMPLKELGIGEKMKDLNPIKHILDKLMQENGISLPPCFQINWDTYQLEPISEEHKPKYCN